MANPWKEKVLAFNRKRKAESEKASDIEIIISKLGELLPGQLKKLLTDEGLCAVLRKYGMDV